MFKWFKKKREQHEPMVPEILKKSLEPMALVVALGECISEYFEDVQNGKLSTPAYKRPSLNKPEGSGAASIWGGTRLEALSLLWDYGASDAMLLADIKKQKELLEVFIEKKPQLECPIQPSNDPTCDTLQAISKVYLFLYRASRALAETKTEKLSMKIFSESRDENFYLEKKVGTLSLDVKNEIEKKIKKKIILA